MTHVRLLPLGGARLNALAQRTAPIMEAAERAKFGALLNDAEVSPAELLALLLRGNVAMLSSSITMAARDTGASVTTVRALAIHNLDRLLAGQDVAQETATSGPADQERRLVGAYLRHMATLRPAAAHELCVIASDIDALFHRDPALNPAAAPAAAEGEGARPNG